MKDELAQVLLAKVMNWTDEENAAERPYLQVMAAHKYDEYQQFSPGMRFIESLALWLNQFQTVEERKIAYDFVKSRMVFISGAEMEHLVASAYSDIIRYQLIEKIAGQLGIPEYMVASITSKLEFKVLLRQSLFLGLSDGAHTDIFRRRNFSLISYEQVYQTYEISDERAGSMLQELKSDLSEIIGREPTKDEVRFKAIFLLDDFSATGQTYLRSEGKTFKGKIAKFYDQVEKPDSALSRLIDFRDASLYIVLYIATDRSIAHLEEQLILMCEGSPAIHKVKAVYRLDKNCPLDESTDSQFLAVIKDGKYYDGTTLEDKHTAMGGTDVKYGFGECRLPVILGHNSPNNSISHLWAYEGASFYGLFPRLPRHWERK